MALENLEVAGSPGMTSIPVSVFTVSHLTLPTAWLLVYVSGRSRPGPTTLVVPFTKEAFLKGTQACDELVLGPQCVG